MARHFLDLPGAATIDTDALALTRRTVLDVTQHRALAVIHGAAGLGKSFAVERALEHLDPQWSPVWVSFPVRPTMRLIATELMAAISGEHSRWDRFQLTRALKSELAVTPRVLVVDEAQNLNRECILCRCRHKMHYAGWPFMPRRGAQRRCWSSPSPQAALRMSA